MGFIARPIAFQACLLSYRDQHKSEARIRHGWGREALRATYR